MNIQRVALAFVLLILAGCVQIPDEVGPATPTGMEKEQTPVEQVPENETAMPPLQEPKPLAQLPEENKTDTSKANASTASTQSPANPAPQTKTVQSGWTTESLTIAEGETKYIYIKK